MGGIPRRRLARVAAGLITASLFVWPSTAADIRAPEFAPNPAVGWIAQGAEFLAPPSGPGPVMNDPAHPRISNAVANATGQQPTFHIGDANSPILQPWAAAQIRKRNAEVLGGKPGYTRQVSCWPVGVPVFLLYPVQPIYFVQTPKQVLMISQEDHMVRHVYLNQPHSANPKPSWYGESVGHYEGDTLVVDTIGQNERNWVDNYRTPHTPALHVTERFRMVDGGKAMEASVHVEDPGAFTTAWNAIQRYRRAEQGPILESFCAENNANFFNHDMEPMPQADKPDF